MRKRKVPQVKANDPMKQTFQKQEKVSQEHKKKRIRKSRTILFLLGLSLFLTFGSGKIGQAQIQQGGIEITTGNVAQFSPSGGGIPTTDVGLGIRDILKHIESFVLKAKDTAAWIGVKNGIRTFLTKIAYDTAVWIASGDNGQKPLLYTSQWKSYLSEAGDAAIGDALQTLATENGFLNFNLCDPYSNAIRLQIQLGLEYTLYKPRVPECTYTQMRQNWAKAIDDPAFLDNFSVAFDVAQNDLGQFITLQDTLLRKKEEEKVAAQLERLNNAFKPVTDEISGLIETPADTVSAIFNASNNQALNEVLDLVGDPLADAVNVFTSTLISKLLDRFRGGFFSLADLKRIKNNGCRDLNFFGISVVCDSGGAAPGVSSAKSQFASLAEPVFKTGEEFEVINDFVTCPSRGAKETNCVIDEGFRIAIQDGLTVKEALDQELLDDRPFGFADNKQPITNPREGYSERSIIILKKFLVVPVGWQVAAEYIRDKGDRVYTLREVMNSFDHCSLDNWSPFCGLVDPNWVLKAPSNFCRREGFGNVVVTSTFVNDDGNNFSPKRQVIARQEECVDAQSCLRENENGTCQAYGYCTEQKRIWKFDGDKCSAQYSSCQTYTNTATGDSVSYLASTVNYNGCNADNASCQWYCRTYNDVSKDWQCAGNGKVYPTCNTAGGCSTNLVDRSENSCTGCVVAQGGFKCETDAKKTCYVGRGQRDNVGQFVDASLNFDRDVKQCSETAAGCTQFMETKKGNNLLGNGSFEYFSGSKEDNTDTDLFGFCDGKNKEVKACSGDDQCAGDCLGWHKNGAVNSSAVKSPVESFGQTALNIKGSGNGADTLSYRVETNGPVGGRSFFASTFYINNNSACTGTITIASDNNRSSEPVSYEKASSWGRAVVGASGDRPYTFPTSDTGTAVTVIINAPNSGCDLLLDGAMLEEVKPNDLDDANTIADYKNYNDNNSVFLNGKRLTCAVEDVGCEAYKNTKGGTVVPAVITNPLSDYCTNPDGSRNYADPRCSQCQAEQVGCDFYQEQPLTNQPPDPKAAGRKGLFCENNQSIPCSNDESQTARDTRCGVASARCVEQISIVPKTGEQCQAQYVGCEQYTNLDEVKVGGEGIEYYTRVKQCVKPQTGDTTQATYYTWVGSETSGFQLKPFTLKVSNVSGYNYTHTSTDENGDPQTATIQEKGNGPCTNLDFSSDSDNPTCKDNIQSPIAVCDENEMRLNPDCGQFYDVTGNIFYRLRSRVITVSDDCHPLRASLDGKVYHAIRGESQTCPAKMNGCREYKGNAAGNTRVVVEDDFENGVWTNGAASADTVAAQGLAMKVPAGARAYTPEQGTLTGITVGNAYIVSFWAKPSSGSSLRAVLQSASGGQEVVIGEQTFSSFGEWNFYRLGPTVFNRTLSSDERFVLESLGADVIVDNVKLTDNASQFLIQSTADICKGFEGCQQYSDRSGTAHYLKSFQKICKEEFIGCKAVVNTQNSLATPFAQTWNTDNADTDPENKDDVVVPADKIVAVVDNDAAKCRSSEKGCTALGKPQTNKQTTPETVTGFNTVTLINDPDVYDTILCQDDALSCQEYKTKDGVTYFKDPREKICEFKEIQVTPEDAVTAQTEEGWFIIGTKNPCPIVNPTNPTSAPVGSVCAGGDFSGKSCQHNTDCPNSFCSNSLSQNNGWVGVCPEQANSCTMYLDSYGKNPTGEEIVNTSFETDSENNASGAATSDGKPDDWEIGSGCGSAVGATGGPFVTDSQSRTNGKSLVVKKHLGATEPECIIKSSLIKIDRNDVYTLRSYVLPQAANGQESFSLGLEFYNSDGDLIPANVRQYCTIDPNTREKNCLTLPGAFYANIAVDNVPITEAKWQIFQGTIGVNQNIEFPASAASVRVRIAGVTAASLNSLLYVDDVTLDHNDPYYYLSDTVDSKSCGGVANAAEGCVVLNNTNIRTMNYRADDPDTLFDESVKLTKSSTGDPVVNCSQKTVNTNDQCNNRANTATGNQIIKVKRDRECSEWLACKTQRTVVKADNQLENVCLQIGTCRGMTTSGVCNDWVEDPDPDLVGGPGLIAHNGPLIGNNIQEQFGNSTGYSKAGLVIGAVGEPTVKGYYPYSTMPELGISGVTSTKEIVPSPNFENTICVQGNVGSPCTKDEHCQVDKDEGYGEGWCANVPAGWSGNGSAAEVKAIDYSDALEVADQSKGALDLNNVLQVTPAGGEPSGAQVNLGKSILQGGEYVLSFDAKYTTTPSPDDKISVGFIHNGNVKTCSGGSRNGEACYSTVDCPSGTCSDITKQELFQGQCEAGFRQGLSCTTSNGICRIPGRQDGVCQGGTRNGQDCNPGATNSCSGGQCVQRLCGSNITGSQCGNLGGRCDFSSACPQLNVDTPAACNFDGLKPTNEWQHYVLGPIKSYANPGTPQNRCSNNINKACTNDGDCSDGDATTFEECSSVFETSLFFNQTTGSSDTPFLIDNVSLKPALEASEQLQLVDRQCRAYPQSNSLQCEYVDDNGIQQRGVRGYCLEKDPLNPQSCLVWWPVDVLSGEQDFVNKQQVGYQERVPLWSCLASRGNVYPRGVCSGGSEQGKACNENADCSVGTCVGLNKELGDPGVKGYKIPTAKYETRHQGVCTYPEDSYNKPEDHQVVGSCGDIKLCSGGMNNGQECVADIDCPDGSCQSIPNQEDSETTKSTQQQCEDSGGQCKDEAGYTIFGYVYNWKQSTMQKTINAYEIERVYLNLGEVNGKTDSKFFFPEGQSKEIKFTTNIVKDCLKKDNGLPDRNCWWYGQIDDLEEGGKDFMYVFGRGDTADNIFAGGNNNTSPDPENEPVNPFTILEKDKNGKTIVNTRIKRDLDNNRDNQNPPEGVGTHPGIRRFDESDNPSQGKGFYEDGGNTIALWLDFDLTGKLRNTYLIVWKGDDDQGYRAQISDMSVSFQLRESCEYVAQTVDNTGINKAWAQRTKRGSAAWVPLLYYNFYQDLAPFGAVTPPPTQPTLPPEAWDSRPLETGNQPPYVELADTSGPSSKTNKDDYDTGFTSPEWQFRAGASFACVGNCDVKVCSSGSREGSLCNTDKDCTTELSEEDKRNFKQPQAEVCVGVGGICWTADSRNAPIIDPDTKAPMPCNRDLDCKGLGKCGKNASGEGLQNASRDSNSLAEQVEKTAHDGANGLRFLFADILDAKQFSTEGTHPGFRQASIRNVWLDHNLDNGFTYYENMSICPSSGRPTTDSNPENDYCGVKPTVKNISINGTVEKSGDRVQVGRNTQVVLQFESHVDPEQIPLATIVIDWDDGSLSTDQWNGATGTHTYTHSYACSVESVNYNKYTGSSNTCEFNPKVRIVDNWDWCSGTELTGDDRNIKTPTDTDGDPTCQTWDVYGTTTNRGLIQVKP